MNAMCETLETRSLMSATMGPTETLVADAPPPQAIGMLLPAVQKVRDAAARMSSSMTATTGDAGASASGHAGGVNVCLADGSVRMGDGSVRFVKDSVNTSGW